MPKKEINILIHDLGSVQFGIIRKLKESSSQVNIFVISNNYVEDIDCTFVGKSKDTTFKQLKEIIKKNHIDFAIIFNELYSFSGLTDYYIKTLKLPLIGVTKKWFNLEAYKTTGKDFMNKNSIKTPDFLTIRNSGEIDNAISELGLPIVIKNNILQAGFGSYICNDKKEAIKTARNLLKKYEFCIAEKFISGKEISQQYLWDRNSLLPLLSVKDFKESENGINTGGLGAYTPVYLTDKEQLLLNEYNNKLEKILIKENTDFTGIFTANLIFSGDDIYTFEFNMRPGITEFETSIEHMDCDLAELLYNCATGNLKNTIIKYKEGITGCIALAHKDYCAQKIKQKYIMLKKGISLVDNNIKINFNIQLLNKKNEALISTNKRFLSVICTDKINPFKKIYKYLDTFDSKSIYYRKGIGIKNEKEFI